MNKIELRNQLKQQYSSFDIDVRNKVYSLMSDDYQFINLSEYISTYTQSQNNDRIDSLNNAFSFTSNTETVNPEYNEKPKHMANNEVYLQNNQANTSNNPEIKSIEEKYKFVSERKRLLAKKIEALRGCSLPNNYLS